MHKLKLLSDRYSNIHYNGIIIILWQIKNPQNLKSMQVGSNRGIGLGQAGGGGGLTQTSMGHGTPAGLDSSTCSLHIWDYSGKVQET